MDVLYYVGAAAASGLYAWWLESLDKAYEPDWTWATVMGGVALTGGWVALRIWLGGLPRELATPLEAAWWVWWETVRMFCATGAPIIGWQLWQGRRRLGATLRYLMGKRRDYEAEAAATLAVSRRGPEDIDD